MKIGFDVAQTCAERAGCAWYADALSRALVDLAVPGDQFFLYHQFGCWINPDPTRGTHIPAVNVTDTFADVPPSEAARIWSSPEELRIKTGAPDIVHANCFQAPRVPGARLVYTVYDVSFWTKPRFATEANRLVCQRGMIEALANADGFIFISESAREEMEQVLPGWLDDHGCPWAVTPLAPRKVFRLPQATAAADAPYWLAVGSLEPRKNYDAILDAYEIYLRRTRLKRPLWIAGGRGWKSESLHERIAQLGPQGVSHLGYVPDEQLATLMGTAEALLFPSWYEGFGLPVVEALACGCPVICSGTTSLPEAGGTAAVYIDPANPGAIAEQMLRLEEDPAWRAELRARSAAAANRLSWAETARLTREFYSRVLSAPPRRFS